MRKISTVELRELEVVNICDGEKIGYPGDFELDIDCGQILSLIVPECDRFNFFGKRRERIIPWDKIECIGEDTILVRFTNEECQCCDTKKYNKRRW